MKLIKKIGISILLAILFYLVYNNTIYQHFESYAVEMMVMSVIIIILLGLLNYFLHVKQKDIYIVSALLMIIMFFISPPYKIKTFVDNSSFDLVRQNMFNRNSYYTYSSMDGTITKEVEIVSNGKPLIISVQDVQLSNELVIENRENKTYFAYLYKGYNVIGWLLDSKENSVEKTIKLVNDFINELNPNSLIVDSK